MIAALFLRGVSRCRSRQFSETLILPPMNHFANGSFQSSALLHFFCQTSSEASRAQNLSGRWIDSRYIALYLARLLMRADAAKSFPGLKRRFSTRCDSMFWLMKIADQRNC